MNVIAQICSAAKKKSLWKAVAFGVPFSIICYLGMVDFTAAAHGIAYESFVLALVVFAVMVVEDWREATVDVRLTAILLVLLLLASRQPAGNFIITGFAAFLFFRSVFVLSALIRWHGCSCKKEECIIQIDGQSCEKFLAFLPSFGGALLLFSISTLFITEPYTILRQFEDAFNGIWMMIPTSLMAAIIVVLLGIWLLMEALFHQLKKRFPEDLEAGIGMGDVIVLPIFAAFLGLTTFTFVLFLSCFLHIGIFFCRNYIHWEV